MLPSSRLARRAPRRSRCVTVIPDQGIGGFGLLPNQHNPYNAFVSISRLQRVLERPGRANAIVLGEVARGSGVFVRGKKPLETVPG